MQKKLALSLFLISCCLSLGGALKYAEMTPLQRHVSFFDSDKDGLISISDTAAGLEKLGMGCVKARAAATAIHLGLASKTAVGWWTPLTLDINLIHRGKHSSDTGVYDTDGNFSKQRFADAYEPFCDIKNANGQCVALSKKAIECMIESNHEDFVGNLAAKAEFGLLLDFAGERCTHNDEICLITMKNLESFYNGNLFYVLAGEDIPD